MQPRIGCSSKLVLLAGGLVCLLAFFGMIALAHGFSSERLVTPGRTELSYTYEDGVKENLYLVIDCGGGQEYRFNASRFPVLRVYDVPAGEQEQVEVRYLWFGHRGLDQIILHLWQTKSPVSNPAPKLPVAQTALPAPVTQDLPGKSVVGPAPTKDALGR